MPVAGQQQPALPASWMRFFLLLQHIAGMPTLVGFDFDRLGVENLLVGGGAKILIDAARQRLYLLDQRSRAAELKVALIRLAPKALVLNIWLPSAARLPVTKRDLVTKLNVLAVKRPRYLRPGRGVFCMSPGLLLDLNLCGLALRGVDFAPALRCAYLQSTTVSSHRMQKPKSGVQVGWVQAVRRRGGVAAIRADGSSAPAAASSADEWCSTQPSVRCAQRRHVVVWRAWFPALRGSTHARTYAHTRQAFFHQDSLRLCGVPMIGALCVPTGP